MSGNYKYLGLCNYDDLVCPFGCQEGTKINNHGTLSTLLGWFPTDPDQDPNHHTMSCSCSNCDKRFTKEWVVKDHNAWYVAEGHVIMGVASCCENKYLIHCIECGGWMKHSIYINNDGITSVRNINGKFIPRQPMYWQCMDCDRFEGDGQYGYEYMTCEDIERAKKEAEKLPPPVEMKIGFRAVDTIGIGVINSEAINKLKIN